MTSLEGDGVIVIYKLNEENFNLGSSNWKCGWSLWTFAALWTNPRQLRILMLIPKWRRNIKGMWRRQCPSLCSIWWTTNLCILGFAKGPSGAKKTLCNIHETKSLSNILFVCRKFFTCKMEEGYDLLNYINEVKALVDQLACLEVPVKNEDVVTLVFHHYFEDNANEKLHYWVRDITFDARDVKEDRARMQRW